MNKIKNIPLTSLKLSKENVRQECDKNEQSFIELKASIAH